MDQSTEPNASGQPSEQPAAPKSPKVTEAFFPIFTALTDDVLNANMQEFEGVYAKLREVCPDSKLLWDLWLAAYGGVNRTAEAVFVIALTLDLKSVAVAQPA